VKPGVALTKTRSVGGGVALKGEVAVGDDSTEAVTLGITVGMLGVGVWQAEINTPIKTSTAGSINRFTARRGSPLKLLSLKSPTPKRA
jgi:hypothetical protein